MGNSSNRVGASALNTDRAAEVRAHVEAVAASPYFAPSLRRSKFLRYVVERTLAGEGEQISEYGIGLDVFDKPPSFDPRLESVVRTELSRLRQKLKEYYSNGGRRDRVVIEFPLRSYAPVFRFVEPAEAPSPPVRPKATNPRIALVAVGIAVACMGALILAKHFGPASPPIQSLVVLPFRDRSADRANEYVADGITEELTNELAQGAELRVLARTSANSFRDKDLNLREVGRRLNVDAAIEGSVVKQGDQMRIKADLYRTSDGARLWSWEHSASGQELPAVQKEMNRAIEAALRDFGSKGPDQAAAVSTSNPDALDLFLRASFQFSQATPEATAKSIELFKAAVDQDPTYARAYLGIGGAESQLSVLTGQSPLEGAARAKAAFRKVLLLDQRSADAHGALAKIKYDVDWDVSGAEQDYQMAVERGARPSIRAAYGWFLATRGRFAEAHKQCLAAEGSDPLGINPRMCQFWTYYFERNYPEAKKALHGILEVYPDSMLAHALLGLIGAIERDCAESTAQFTWTARKYAIPMAKCGLAYASACGGDRTRARAYLKEAESARKPMYTSPYQLALGYAFLHDRDTAIAYLRKSADDREGQIHYLKYEPVFEEIRSDPRYVALEKLAGIDP